MKKLVLAILMGGMLALGGCATTQYNYVPKTEEISRPPIGEVATASIGDSLLAQGRSKKTDILVFDENTPLPTNKVIITSGFLTKSGEDNEQEYFVITNREGSSKITSNSILGTPEAIESIGINKNTQKLSTISKMPPPYGNVRLEERKPINFKRETRVFNDPASFQQTLIYNGKVGNKINIAYREYAGDMARPAFSNNVEYDLADSKIIGYKGAELEVIEANNQSIKYKVLKNFNKATQ